ncbi:MAG: S1 RNA-binding domain-containing protein, partial [Firmicutes bacterium]|nr:S1 RNA-binding domain-containing protein [Bacillota bacterium]
MAYNIGEIIEGKVSGIAKFGVFIDLPDGTRGLVHISEISNNYVKEISDHIKLEEKRKVM